MLQGNREIQKWVCGKPTNTSTCTKPPQLWADVFFCVIHLSGGLETTNGMRSTKPQHKVSYYCASKFMIIKEHKATCSSVLFCTFHWIWLASHLALLVDPAGRCDNSWPASFTKWLPDGPMVMILETISMSKWIYRWHVSWQVPFLLQIFADISLTQKISQRKAHVLADLHFWLVEITQKWDDVRLEPKKSAVVNGQQARCLTDWAQRTIGVCLKMLG